MPQKILGLVGPQGCGKTTLGHLLASRHNFFLTSFSTPIRRMAISLMEYACVPSPWYVFHFKKREPLEQLDGLSMTTLMQTLGTDWGRIIHGQDFWTKIWKSQIGTLNRVVVDDVRFRNELDEIQRLGGSVVRINRPGVDYRTNHESEIQSALLKANHEIRNEGPPENMLEQIKHLL